MTNRYELSTELREKWKDNPTIRDIEKFSLEELSQIKKYLQEEIAIIMNTIALFDAEIKSKRKYHKLSEACKRGTAYRKVIGRIINFAEKELKQLYPELSREERIIKAHEEPFFTASKELRDLTEKERMELGLTSITISPKADISEVV